MRVDDVRDFWHETVFEGLESESAGHRRPWNAKAEAARVFRVPTPTVRCYLRLRWQTGNGELKPLPGPPPRKGATLPYTGRLVHRER
jgi:hypothetical protein